MKVSGIDTIRIEEYQGHKLLKGFNTDVIGFEETIYPEIKSSAANNSCHYNANPNIIIFHFKCQITQ